MRTLIPFLGLLITACAPVADSPTAFTPDPGVEPAEPVTPNDPADPTDPVVETDPETMPMWDVGSERSHSSMTLPYDDDSFIMAAPDERGVWIVDTDGTNRFISLDAEITRLVRVGDFLLATARDTGELLRLSRSGDRVRVEQRIFVGTEPYDVVTSFQSDKAWVSLSVENAVVELDLPTFAETRRFDVMGEPHSMLIRSTSAGEELIVASAYAARLSVIDLAAGTVQMRALPQLNNDLGQRLIPRITGDMALNEATGDFLVPTVYADTSIPGVPGDGTSTAGAGSTGGSAGTPPPPPSGPNGTQDEGEFLYGSLPNGEMPDAKGVFNPAIVKVSASNNTSILPLATASMSMDFDSIDFARGIPTSITVLPDYAMQPSSTPLIMVASSSGHMLLLDEGMPPFMEAPAGFTPITRAAFPVGPGARGAMVLASSPEHVYSVAAHGTEVVRYDLNQAWEITMESGFGMIFGIGRPPEEIREVVGYLPPSPLPANVFEGRALFHDASDARIALPGSGATCAGCHLEGRTDGRTWRFEDFPRQTPSLAGHVSSTLPLTWTGEVGSVLEEVHTTSSSRMGGAGLTDDEALAVAAYVDWTREVSPVLPTTPAHDAAVAEGADLFADPTVGCITCHSGSERTDGNQYPLYGLASVDTPSLNGIAGSAPYLHDGSAHTLRDVLERSRDGSMGNTGHLTDAQMESLVAYLRTL